ncbi:hypothetical protein AB9K35_21605 [Leisingera sp. XS_AS12]|jgi:hypothetical protein|nr:hypothetical protein [Nocardioides marinus]
MTNRIAIALGVLLTLAAVVDIALFGNQHMVFLGKKLFALIHWLAFWR